MIELNLLPEEYKKKKKKLELPEIPIIPIAAMLVGVLVVLQLLLAGLIFMSKNRLSSLDKIWQDLAPKKAELDSIKLEIKNTGKKIEAIDNLIQKRLSWAHLLNELSNSLTANIWLTELLYQERAEKSAKKREEEVRVRTLLLSGSASVTGEEATRDIARFIKALKANENFFKSFEDVELVSIRKGAILGQELMDFTLVCKFKPEEPGE